MLNNALYLNKHLHIFKLSDTKLCSFCSQEDKAVIHLSANCSKSKTLWNSLKEFFKDTINLPSLTPQSAIFGIYCYLNTTYMFQDVLKPFHLQPLKQISKNVYSGNLFKYDEKKKKFSSKSGVKFWFISNHVITFSVGEVWVYFWHYLLCLIAPAGMWIILTLKF